MFRFLWSIRPYFRQVAGELLLGSIAGILMNTAVVLPAILLGQAIDIALAFSRQEVPTSAVTRAVLLFVAGTIATEAPRLFKRWFLITANGRMRANLRADLLRGVLSLPMDELSQIAIGDLMARIVGDVEVWGLGVRRFVIETWDTMLFTISLVAAMIWYDPQLTLIALATTPLGVLLSYASGRWVRTRTTRARQANADYTAVLQEQLAGMRILRLFGRTEAAVKHIADLSQRQAEANLASERLRAALRPLYVLLMSAGAVVVVWQGSERVLAGLLTVGGFVAYLELYLRAVNRGFSEVPVVINQVQASAAAYARLQSLVAQPLSMSYEPRFASFLPNHMIYGSPNGKHSTNPTLSAGATSVELDGVTFRYPGTSEPSLKDLSLSIPAGALVAVTGPVGSGKSALARVLLDLYPLDAGVIRFNGQDARIGYLPQEPFLFSGSVRENILFGADSLEISRESLAAAALSEDLRTFPARLETQIGELGIRVSGGQRQRIALARALAAFAPDAPGLLVLDDPFSAVDVNTEAQMIAALRQSFGPQAPLQQQATIILCSHRLAAFAQADLIVVLDEGSIREQGSHVELMQAGGLYSRIFTAQQRAEGKQ